MDYLKRKKILVTGATGFLGTHVVDQLIHSGVSPDMIISASSKDVDLRENKETDEFVKSKSPDIVIALAARLGGIGDNRIYPASYFYDNIMIGINTIEACRKQGVEKLVNIGTVCSYPKILPAPFKEEDLWNGYPEETNAPYGIAKKSVMEYGKAVYQQYGFKNVNLLMTNLYGPGDDFREATSHVIPAIIKKVLKAKENGEAKIIAWGDGSPSRDFIYVKDAAKAIVMAAVYFDHPQPVNIGSGQEVTIKDLIEKIKTTLNYKGKTIWDTTKPNGQPRRILDTSKAFRYFRFRAEMPFDQGLRSTIEWYLAKRNEIDALPTKFQE